MDWELLFDTPWWLPAGLILAGVALWVSGNNRRDRALRGMGTTSLVLAVALMVVSYVVQTPVEQAEQSSRMLVRSVVSKDLARIDAILDSQAHVVVQGGDMLYANRRQITEAIQRATDLFGIKSAIITSLTSERQGPFISVAINVLSVQSATMDQGFPTSWLLEYQQHDDQWKLWRITFLKAARLSTLDVAKQFPVLPQP